MSYIVDFFSTLGVISFGTGLIIGYKLIKGQRQTRRALARTRDGYNVDAAATRSAGEAATPASPYTIPERHHW